MQEQIQKIKDDIHKFKKEAIESDNIRFKQGQEIQLVLGSVKNDTHSLKNGQEKNSLVLFGIIFVAGLLIGSQYKTWLPYANEIVNTVKNVREVAR